MPVSKEAIRNILLLVGGASLLVFALRIVGFAIELHFDIKLGSL